MGARKIAMALFACLALGASAANAAQAAEGWTIGTTENQTTGGTLIANGTHERISCKRHGTSSLVFTTKLLGSAVEITFEGVDCLEKAGSVNAATIDNTTSKGHSEGVLTFTGAKVIKPENCEVPGGEVTTNPLTDEVIMDPTEGSTVVYDRFFPEVTANGFFTLELRGAKCSLAESSATLKGSFCGESVHTNGAGTGYEPNKTGTLTKVQTLLFGEAQQKTGNSAGKTCALTFGAEVAQLTGAVDSELTGANAGKPFGSDGEEPQPPPPTAGWTIGTTENQTTPGTFIAKGTHELIGCKRHGTSTLILTGTLLGSSVEMSVEGFDCLETSIDNTTSNGHSEGRLTFTGVKVLKPPTKCTVGNAGKASSGEITTEAVTDEAIMDPTVGSTVVYDRFFPEVVGGAFATIEFGGAECLVSELATTVRGSFCGELVHTNAVGTGYEPNKTGTLTKVQTLLFGAGQQSTGGCALTLGGKAAQLTGAVDTELVGASFGKPFGVD